MSDEDWDDENFQDVIVESPQDDERFDNFCCVNVFVEDDELTIYDQNGEELKTYIIQEAE